MARIDRFCPNCGVKFLGRTDRPNAFCSHSCAATMRRKEREVPIKDRFWSKVARGTVRQCWEWQASLHPLGYGQFGYNGSSVHAHRVAWELTHGPVADGLYVLHKCDNRKCVNPAHLFLGTQVDNIADMVAKGRQRGRQWVSEESHFAKLTTAQVADIRARLAAGKRGTARALAAEYGVSEATISVIKHDKTWH